MYICMYDQHEQNLTENLRNLHCDDRLFSKNMFAYQFLTSQTITNIWLRQSST